MAETDDLRKKHLDHRHDFLMNYYNMAVNDLDRFQKIGVQTISSLVGFVVVISLGFKGELPLTLSICFGITVLGWGWANIIDSNYWSIRAISFLSNIESVYFKKEERKFFNPYVGYYPPYKIIASLKNQIFLIVIFIIIAFILSFQPAFDNINNKTVLQAIDNISYLNLLYYSSPIVLNLVLLYFINFRFLARAKDYLSFIQECPGPGLINDENTFRTVDLNIIGDASKLIDGSNIHASEITKIGKRIKRLKRYDFILLYGSIFLFLAGNAIIIYLKLN